MPRSSRKKTEPERPLRDEIVEALKNTFDPELGIDIYTLGFIRKIQINPDKEAVLIEMTLTSPLCPYGPRMLREVEGALKKIGLKRIRVEFVFDPPWQPSSEVRQMLGV